MSDYAYPNKTRQISIFKSKTVRVRNENKGGTFVQRDYLNPKDQFIHAYIREDIPQSNEQSNASFRNNRWIVVINYRKGIERDYFVEYKDGGETRVIRILAVDEFEGKHTELKLICEEVPTPAESGARHYARWTT
jgi:head-tail adaptor